MENTDKKELDKKVYKTNAEKIWEEIKDMEINMFALPNQIVSNFCKPVVIEPTKCYLLSSATSLLPQLEDLLRNRYAVELMDKYIVVAPIKNKF